MPASGQPHLHRNQFGLRGVQLPSQGASSAPSRGGGSASMNRDGDKSKLYVMAAAGAAGLGILGYLLLAGGGKSIAGPMVYNDAVACSAARTIPAQVCQNEWRAAQALRMKLAPSYPTMAACEGVHGPGKCQQPATPGDPLRAASYIPVMAAYVLAREGANGPYKAAPLHQVRADGPGK
ncbi:MAG: DUF1190 domain-containing protein, partial [Alphaproteobacteria bacterium]|nr:DUF1190 domain-containing protein [Alphaproteobacteria bacterium]